MADYLAEVVMPEERTNEIIEEQLMPDSEEEDLELEIEEDSEQLIPDEEPEEEEAEESIPEPVRKREKIPQDEIFNPPKVKTILEPEIIESTPPEKPPKGFTKSGKPRKKRVMSEKQLENLKKGRETSLANRKKKRDMRLQEKKVKEEDAELVRKYKAKERERLKKEVETPLEDRVIAKPQIIEKPVVVEKGYSQDQLDDAVSRAVEQSVNRVEILRKQRKEIKKKATAKANHDAKIFKDINSALKNDVWANCFL